MTAKTETRSWWKDRLLESNLKNNERVVAEAPAGVYVAYSMHKGLVADAYDVRFIRYGTPK